MKQWIAPMIILAMMATLAGCGSQSETTSNNNAQQGEIQSSIGEIIPQEKADNVMSGKIVKEFLSIADFNRDGVKETAKVVAFGDGEYFELQICNSEENILWKTEASKAHMGWLSLFLCQSDGKDYLLRYTPYMSQGACHYQYDLFILIHPAAKLWSTVTLWILI